MTAIVKISRLETERMVLEPLEPCHAEERYALKGFQKQGYAKEGMKEIMTFIGAHYPVQKFVIEMDTRNLPSVLLALSLGFRWVKTTNRVASFKGNESHEFRFEYGLEPVGCSGALI